MISIQASSSEHNPAIPTVSNSNNSRQQQHRQSALINSAISSSSFLYPAYDYHLYYPGFIQPSVDHQRHQLLSATRAPILYPAAPPPYYQLFHPQYQQAVMVAATSTTPRTSAVDNRRNNSRNNVLNTSTDIQHQQKNT